MAPNEVGLRGELYKPRASTILCLDERMFRAGELELAPIDVPARLELQIAQEGRWIAPSIWNWMLIERGWTSSATAGLSACSGIPSEDSGTPMQIIRTNEMQIRLHCGYSPEQYDGAWAL